MHVPPWVEVVRKDFFDSSDKLTVGSLESLVSQLRGHLNLPLKAGLRLRRRGRSCAELGLASRQEKFPGSVLSLW